MKRGSHWKNRWQQLLRSSLSAAALAMACGGTPAVFADWSDYYTIEDIEPPEGVVPEVGGITLLEDGRLVFAFNRGEVYFYDPEAEEWSRFAEGLHNPLGVYAESPEKIYVTQYPEITVLRDTDKDGRADHYQTLNDQFGLSGGYAEFHFGLVRDGEGNFYSGLGTASIGAGVRYETRGEFNPDGRPGRMYSAVPYRGWVIRTSPDGEMTPYAFGLRMPNGLGFDEQGRLLVTDNQGDWVGTSPIFHVEENKFYGHAGSFLWTPGWDKGPPLKVDPAFFERERTRPAVEFPHGVLSNSPTEPVQERTGGRFGPFENQFFIGEMNHPHLIRVMFDEVAGDLQGAAVKFHDGNGLTRGNNRMVFDSQGRLWLGKTQRDRGWAGSTGIQRITWTGRTPMEIEHIALTEDGFRVHFTEPVDPQTLPKGGNYRIKRYQYRYDEAYGSPPLGSAEVGITHVTVSEDRREVDLRLDKLVPRYIYEFDFSDVKSSRGQPVMHPLAMYTLGRLHNGSSHYVFTADADGGAFCATDGEQIGMMNSDAEHTGYTGGGFAAFRQNNTASSLRWTINLPAAGTYDLAFRYSLAYGNRPLRVVVNDRTIKEALDFPHTGAWNRWEEVSMTADLAEGVNVIALEQIDIRGAAIDRVAIKLVQ